jgi:hypothetical protein
MADGVGFEIEISPVVYVVARMGCRGTGDSFADIDTDLSGNKTWGGVKTIDLV